MSMTQKVDKKWFTVGVKHNREISTIGPFQCTFACNFMKNRHTNKYDMELTFLLKEDFTHISIKRME